MEFETPLCELAFKYGTDKCPQINHSYTPFYWRLLNSRRETIRKVVELGIGHPGMMVHTPKYQVGASLRMWRDFFPNAQVYGADVLPETMFGDDRIKTMLCDETQPKDLRLLIDEVGPDVDLFIDDGLHSRRAQIETALTVLPLLNPGVIYVIEDINHPEKILAALADYDCLLIEGTNKRRSDKMIIVRHRA